MLGVMCFLCMKRQNAIKVSVGGIRYKCARRKTALACGTTDDSWLKKCQAILRLMESYKRGKKFDLRVAEKFHEKKWQKSIMIIII